MKTRNLLLIAAVAVIAMLVCFSTTLPAQAKGPNGTPTPTVKPGGGDPPTGDPVVWTDAACLGNAAIVLQEETNTGDGVTLSAEDPWGCAEPLSAEMVLVVVEPWDGNGDRAKGYKKYNQDRSCLASDWSEVQDFVLVTGLGNLSVWIASNDLLDNPVTVLCDEVTDSKSLGLNTGENQLDVKVAKSTLVRFDELLKIASMTREDYYAEFPDLPLTDALQALEKLIA